MSEYKKLPVRAAAILTTSYVAGAVIELNPNHNQLVIYLDFTLGSLTSLELKVEFSNNSTDFFQESHESSVAAGVATVVPKNYTVTATGKYRIPIPVKDRYVKISTKGTGTVSGSSAAVDVIIDQC